MVLKDTTTQSWIIIESVVQLQHRDNCTESLVLVIMSLHTRPTICGTSHRVTWDTSTAMHEKCNVSCWFLKKTTAWYRCWENDHEKLFRRNPSFASVSRHGHPPGNVVLGKHFRILQDGWSCCSPSATNSIWTQTCSNSEIHDSSSCLISRPSLSVTGRIDCVHRHLAKKELASATVPKYPLCNNFFPESFMVLSPDSMSMQSMEAQLTLGELQVSKAFRRSTHCLRAPHVRKGNV